MPASAYEPSSPHAPPHETTYAPPWSPAPETAPPPSAPPPRVPPPTVADAEEPARPVPPRESEAAEAEAETVHLGGPVAGIAMLALDALAWTAIVKDQPALGLVMLAVDGAAVRCVAMRCAYAGTSVAARVLGPFAVVGAIGLYDASPKFDADVDSDTYWTAALVSVLVIPLIDAIGAFDGADVKVPARARARVVVLPTDRGGATFGVAGMF